MEGYIMKPEEVITKKDFEKLAQQLIKLIQTAVSSFDSKTSASSSAFQKTLADVRAQVDSLFVGEKVAKMEKGNQATMEMMGKEHKALFAKLEGKIEEIVNQKLKEVDTEVRKRALPGKPGPKGDPGTISIELAQKALEPWKKELKGEWDKKVQALIDSKKMIGGTPHNLLQIFNATSQADGFKRIFTNLPTARFYPMIFLRGQNPVALAADVDYTIGRNSITLNDSIEPPASGVGVFVQFIK